MKTMKLKLAAATITLMAAGFGPSLAQAAPAIGAPSVANAAAPSVETVHYRGRHYGHRRYGNRYGYGYGYGHRGRHWRHRHNGFPAGLVFGSILGFGDIYGPGYYGRHQYGYGPGYYRGW